MKSHEQRFVDAISSLTARLTAWGVTDPESKAHEFVRDLLAHGWRTTKADLELPPTATRPGDTQAGVDACRAGLRAGTATKEDA